MKLVEKKWGEEQWIINEPEYCAKFLYVNKDATSSLHYHPKKKETFYCLEGHICLVVEGKKYVLVPENNPVTINPGQAHRFKGINNKSLLLEISTHHDDRDVVRLSESQSSQES